MRRSPACRRQILTDLRRQRVQPVAVGVQVGDEPQPAHRLGQLLDEVLRQHQLLQLGAPAGGPVSRQSGNPRPDGYIRTRPPMGGGGGDPR